MTLTNDQISNLDALNMMCAFMNGDEASYQQILDLYVAKKRKDQLIMSLTTVAACMAAPPIVPVEQRMDVAETVIAWLRHHLLEHSPDEAGTEWDNDNG